MVLALVVMIASTAAASLLTWQLVKIVKIKGVAYLLNSSNAGGTLLYFCLLFTWLLVIRDGLDVLLSAAPLDSMLGFFALFTGVFAMRLAGIKKQFPIA